MSIESLEMQLDRIQHAIATIEEGAQEYEILGRRVRKSDLSILYRRERDLINRINAEKYGTRVYAGWSNV